MAKKGGKSKGFISQGKHSNVSRKVTNAIRNEYLKSGDRVINQLHALQKGKDIVVTIENPIKEQTHKRFIKVRISGRDYLARMKERSQSAKRVDPE